MKKILFILVLALTSMACTKQTVGTNPTPAFTTGTQSFSLTLSTAPVTNLYELEIKTPNGTNVLECTPTIVGNAIEGSIIIPAGTTYLLVLYRNLYSGKQFQLKATSNAYLRNMYVY